MAAPENTPSDDPESELSNLEFLDSDDFENTGTTSDSDNAATEIEQVFQDAIQVAHLEDRTQQKSTHGRPPGPGLLESIFWMFGVFGAHFAGIMIFTIGAFIYLISTTNLGQDAVTIQKNLKQFFENHPLEMAGVEQGIFVLFALAAIGLRLSKGVFAKVNLQPFAISTGLLLFICVLPLSMLSGEFYRIAFEAWSTFSEQLPFLKRFNELQTMEMVKQMAENSPLWALVLVIAVLPAIGEEIVFRGVIGRGLLARWGLIPGILITSFMFGIVHVHPAHVIAVIPLGMFMHFVYYVTRSFWAPVLVHFLNNAFAVSMAKMISELPENAAKLGDEKQVVHPLITLTAALFITVVCIYLWKTRAKYITRSGNEWTPGYISNERPPEGDGITLERKPADLGFYPGLALLYLVFLATIGMFGLQ